MEGQQSLLKECIAIKEVVDPVAKATSNSKPNTLMGPVNGKLLNHVFQTRRSIQNLTDRPNSGKPLLPLGTQMSTGVKHWSCIGPELALLGSATPQRTPSPNSFAPQPFSIYNRAPRKLGRLMGPFYAVSPSAPPEKGPMASCVSQGRQRASSSSPGRSQALGAHWNWDKNSKHRFVIAAERRAKLDATTFYDQLAPMFDVMTDWDSRLEAEGPFLFRILEQIDAHTVLDAACGSGGHALALAEKGYDVVGTDISSAMIALARAKASGKRRVRFHVARLGELSWRFRSFDAVICLGNSLPHILAEKDLAATLTDLANCLRPGGVLLLHNLNYDRRWLVRPRWFAVDSGVYQDHQVLVWRFADYVDTPEPRIDFHIALFRQSQDAGWSVHVISTPQRPLFQADLVRMLPDAGLTDILFYGDLTGSTFVQHESPDLVVVAHRPV